MPAWNRPGWRAAALLVLAVAGLAGGLGARLAGADRLGDRLLALTVAAGLLPLGVSVAHALARREPGVDVIALLAMAGALALGQALAGAVIAVMLASGRLLEAYAGTRAARELRALLERAPRVVHRYQHGGLASPPLEAVRPGDRLLVKPGEVVPVDGRVQGPTAVLDESALTGEAELVERHDGEQVRSGVVNAGAPFDLRATTTAATSTYASILRLVEQAQASKAPFVRLADRYALAFVPLTLAIAGAAWLLSGEAVRALAVLVVATPCPLILAAPVAIVAGISRAARRGIVVKSGGALERLAAGRVLLFDKTGTLTAGAPVVAEVQGVTVDGDQLLGLAASLDQVSQHVLAGAIVRAAAERQLPLVFPAEVEEEPGRGVRGRVGDRRVAVGKAAWAAAGRPLPPWARRLRRRGALEGFSTVFVAVDGVLAGALAVQDPVRPDATRTLRELRRAGLQRVVLVTGDNPDVADMVGAAVGVDEVLAERSPAEKVEAARLEREAGSTIMVGDGINDAPALAAADVGVAMGARGATASSEAADVVLVVDRFDRLAEAIAVARRSRRIALESVLAGMGLSLAAMGMAAAGLLAPVAGAVLQEAIDVAVIANALRALGAGRVARRPPSRASVALGQRFRAEHRELLALVDRVRAVADGLDRLPPSQALVEASAVHRFLTERLLPHEEAEDALLYPAVAELLGGEDPTAPMSRAHAEIAHLTRLLGGVLADLGPAGPEPEDRTDLRRILYGLHAILRLHFAQEEEAYLSLLDHGGQERAASGLTGPAAGAPRRSSREGAGRLVCTGLRSWIVKLAGREPGPGDPGGPVMSLVTEHLAERGVSFEVVPHRRVVTSLQEARELGVAAEEVLKTVALWTGGKYVLAVVPASRRLDLRRVREALEDPGARLATEAELAADFPGYALGALPPLGSLLGVLVLVDPEVLEQERVVFTAGRATESVRVVAAELFRDEPLGVVPLTRRDRRASHDPIPWPA